MHTHLIQPLVKLVIAISAFYCLYYDNAIPPAIVTKVKYMGILKSASTIAIAIKFNDQSYNVISSHYRAW